MNTPLPRAIDFGLATCHTCHMVSPETHGECPRCHSSLHLRKPNSIRNTLAFMVAAVLLYIPSNILPILSITELGEVYPNTIVQGIITFWKSGAYPIALVIFTASVLIPLLKIVSLSWLCAAASGKANPSPRTLSRIYWFTELLGRWSMIDVFVVGILVSIVQLGNYMTVIPGKGAVAFTGVVLLTMIAAHHFDPRLLWDRFEQAADKQASPTHNPPSL